MKERSLPRLRRHIPTVFCAAALAAGFAFAVALTPPLFALSAEDAPTRFYRYASGLGADGYDVVSYFTDSRAVEGDAEFTAEYAGKTWRFSSSSNRDAFAADPARYAPHYGGHCAYGVAQGYLVFGDPKAWSVHDGVLYFNYNIPTRDRWLSRRGQYIAESERAWPKLAR